MMLFILGLDGLDYRCVTQWNLVNLKQQEFGKIIVPISQGRKQPLSPEVWGSFLTGEELTGLNFSRPGIKGKVLGLLISLRKRVNFGFGMGNHFRTKRNFPKLNRSTFIDREGVTEINAPYYSYNGTIDIVERIGRGEISLNDAVSELMEIYRIRKRQIKQELMEKMLSNEVIFAFLHFPDMVQHLALSRERMIKSIYADLDYFIVELKEIINDGVFIIVSDHGFDPQTGYHSRFGFYSSNTKLDPKPEKITDFYHHLITRFIKNST